MENTWQRSRTPPSAAPAMAPPASLPDGKSAVTCDDMEHLFTRFDLGFKGALEPMQRDIAELKADRDKFNARIEKIEGFFENQIKQTDADMGASATTWGRARGKGRLAPHSSCHGASCFYPRDEPEEYQDLH